MAIRVEINTSDWERQLQRNSEIILVETWKQLRKELRHRAINYYQEITPIRTGALLNSLKLRMRASKSGYTATISWNTHYASFPNTVKSLRQKFDEQYALNLFHAALLRALRVTISRLFPRTRIDNDRQFKASIRATTTE